ncbi:MAG: ferritin-like domain-containing protein [Dehalococcoidia bacterium]|jgi:bacterioferritin|nr:ferritin-like domain-containing protein [Dehalococcoidia bacterium]
MGRPKASQEFIDMLNEALAEEMASIFQYMWDHILARGMESLAIAEKFKELAMTEMRHAYMLAERIDLLGGVPTTQVAPIKIGGDLRQMVEDNLQLEYEAIDMYRRLIKQAEKEEDPASRRLLEEILKDTEEHARDLEALLGK